MIEETHDLLRTLCRKKAGRNSSPSLGLIDSQTVHVSSMTHEKGYECGQENKCGLLRKTDFAQCNRK